MKALFIKIHNWIAIEINIFYSIYLMTKSEEWHKKNIKSGVKKTTNKQNNSL